MQSVETMTERILYWLSLNTQVRTLAERLLERFAVTVGDLPASAQSTTTPSPAVSRGTRSKSRSREEFEGNINAFIKLGIGRPDAVSDHAFVENRLLIPKTPN